MRALTTGGLRQGGSPRQKHTPCLAAPSPRRTREMRSPAMKSGPAAHPEPTRQRAANYDIRALQMHSTMPSAELVRETGVGSYAIRPSEMHSAMTFASSDPRFPFISAVTFQMRPARHARCLRYKRCQPGLPRWTQRLSPSSPSPIPSTRATWNSTASSPSRLPRGSSASPSPASPRSRSSTTSRCPSASRWYCFR